MPGGSVEPDTGVVEGDLGRETRQEAAEGVGLMLQPERVQQPAEDAFHHLPDAGEFPRPVLVRLLPDLGDSPPPPRRGLAIGPGIPRH